MKKLSYISSLAALVLFSLWFYGFLGFLDEVGTLHEPGVRAGLESTDAIVVLTGGSERVTTALDLLESGNGKKLFISGVNRRLSLDKILGSQHVPSDLRNCCIVLGYRASSTIGNAEETHEWLNAEGYRSIRLVTANYHMPRSLLLFHTAMPDIVIISHPITPDSVKLRAWWLHPGTIYLIATEYSKYLVVSFKIWLSKGAQ